ncbi:GNAT family N-acetyltransferase [Microbacterium hydrocarbonoxydans]|uniref:GNAT family N-acetyltransferase n=1 Tax=Microbacterium hydrocarbonoxydans TaxID=273678 RepID=UPI0013DD4816|nr:GNAT family N-acetyltransferase [Microbacterium hydrocarbonoxydans]
MTADAHRQADRDAEAAASRSGLGIRLLDRIEDHAEVRALIEEVWRTGERNPPVTADMLSAIRTAGGYVSGAFDDRGLAAACLGFFGPPAGRRLHSHIAVAHPRTRGSGIGTALKLHQRAWALHQGARTITWTFDPLIRRNAWFNLGKLAAGVGGYLPDLYGTMDDAINRDDITDRVLARWPLTDPAVTAAAAGRPSVLRISDLPDAVIAVSEGADGRPVLGTTDAPTVLVGVPADIESLRETDPAASAAWRLAIRQTLGVLLAEGAVVRGFDRDGWYIIDRTEKP